MPFFDDFLLDVAEFGEKQKINLSWKQKGSDYPMQPYHLSDGSLRFICLSTALLQPNPPSTIIIDEPELGLHPAAISILAELIQNASKRTQVIVATQSPALIDNFMVEDIIVVNRKDGASTFERLEEKDFNIWLETYSVGELWSKNVISGGPVYE
jgi:predicted ATPase